MVYHSPSITNNRDNPDAEDVEYPPPQPLDGEIDRLMDTDEQNDFVVASESAIPDDKTAVESSKHAASDPTGEREDGEDVEELGSEDEEDEEEDDGDISLEEEELEEEGEEDIEGEEDEEMRDVDAADEDVTMQSIENGTSAQPVAQTS
jgi:hypothetical protein